jgi:hypothetical protein
MRRGRQQQADATVERCDLWRERRAPTKQPPCGFERAFHHKRELVGRRELRTCSTFLLPRARPPEPPRPLLDGPPPAPPPPPPLLSSPGEPPAWPPPLLSSSIGW